MPAVAKAAEKEAGWVAAEAEAEAEAGGGSGKRQREAMPWFLGPAGLPTESSGLGFSGDPPERHRGDVGLAGGDSDHPIRHRGIILVPGEGGVLKGLGL